MKLCSKTARAVKSTRRNSTTQEAAAEIELFSTQGRLRDALLTLGTNSVHVLSHTYKCLLQCCTASKALDEGRALHSLILTSTHISIAPLESALVYMYLQSDCIQDARHVFDRMARWDVFVWNVMIAAYTRNGHGGKAFQIFAAMDKAFVPKDEITYLNILKTCKFLGTLDLGRWVHLDALRTKCQPYLSVENSLLGMYAHHGSLDDAYCVFKHIESKDVVSWTLLIAGYVMHGFAKEALAIYSLMKSTTISPDKVTFLSVLQACCCLGDLDTGQQVHGQATLLGLDLEAFLASALVNLYSKCGSLQEAQQLFYTNAVNDLASCNALIAGYGNLDRVEDSFKLFGGLLQRSLTPDQVTFLNVINACALFGDVKVCAEIHTHLVNDGFDSDLQIMNSLLDMYAKLGCMDDAWHVFSQLHDKDVVSWTAIITGLFRQGLDDKAFQLLEKMKREGINPDKFALVSVLGACAGLKSLEKGRLIHAYLLQIGFELDAFMVSTLVDLYSKSGHLSDARHVFDSINKHDIVSWTAMIVAYAQHGCGKDALELMGRMLDNNVMLNHVTLVAVLSACSHSGLVEEGHYLLDLVKQKGAVTKTAEHYACMIDLLTRAGCLEEAKQLLTDLPFEPNVSMWLSLLRSCIMCGNGQLAKCAAENVLKLKPGNEAAFVLLSNTCVNGDGNDSGYVM